MINNKDKSIIQDLAKRYKQLADDPKCHERVGRIRKTNSLNPCRPIVWLEEIPWHELNFDGLLDLHCELPLARDMERYFRQILLRWEYFQADMVVEDCFYIQKSFDVTDVGLEVSEDTVAIDSANHIISHSYHDVLDTEEKVDMLKPPVVTADPELDKKQVEIANDLLDGILPVKLRGQAIYHAPWDYISRLRGVEPIFIDIVDKPELIHKTINTFTEFNISRWKQMEALGLLESKPLDIHCTPAYCDDLPETDEKTGAKLKDVWFRGMAQLFGAVSPQMHDEFDLQYMKKAMEMCGPVYYGCCEPLDKKIYLLKQIPNMRKIGVSTWADTASSAEQIGGDYVYSYKPNPAYVAGTVSEEAVRNEVTKVVEACLRHGCPYDIVLKDTSTVSYKVENLTTWSRVVQETLDKYY